MNNAYLPSLTRIKHITINIHNVSKMVSFYTNILGMKVIESSKTHTNLGYQQTVLLTLMHDKVYPFPTKKTQGLYHVAYLVSNRTQLGEFLLLLRQENYPIGGLSDHGVSEAIYLQDPEGNGIEVYCDYPIEKWPTSDGKLSMITKAMNVKNVLSHAKKANPLSSDTVIGHLHFHVSNLYEAEQFYTKIFSFTVMQHYGSSASFLSDGIYHHLLGINTWLGNNIPKKNRDEQGFRGYTLYGNRNDKIIDIAGLEVEIVSI